MTRRLLALLALTLLLAGLAASSASAYTGTSVDDNVSPTSDVHGLADRWPSNRFGLDHHAGDVVKTIGGHVPGSGGLIGPKDKPGFLDWVLHKTPTGIDTDALEAGTKHSIAEVIWDGVRYGTSLVITVLTFALSLDLLSGAHGLLEPVAHAGQQLFGEMRGGWLQVGVIALGLYFVVFALMRRQITQTFGKIAVSFLMVSFALLLINHWDWTVGATSKYTNEASLAIIGTVNGDKNADARQGASDALMDTLIVNPFLVLNFGGLEHCVDKDSNSVKPKSDDCTPTRSASKAHGWEAPTAEGGTLINNRKYLTRWLDAGPPNSAPRQLEYEAIRDAKTPDASAIKDAGLPANAFDGYKLTAADTPAVDIQQREIAGDRLIVALLVGVGALGAWLLIGGLAVGIIAFKLLAVLLFGVTSVVAVAALFPGAGHRTFWAWAERLILALTLSVWYSLILALVLMMSRGLTAAGPEFGWKLTFFILAVFWWAVFLLRKHAISLVMRSLPGSTGAGRHDRSFGDMAQGWYYKSKMLLPAAAGAGAGVGAVLHGSAERRRRDPEYRGGLVGVLHHTRQGARDVRQKVSDYATDGHTERTAANAALHDRALRELEAEHDANVKRHGEEAQLRAERHELEQRQRTGPGKAADALRDNGLVLDGSSMPSSRLTPAEERRLRKLQDDAMPKQEFDALGLTINDVDRRRKDTGGQPFSTEQINERAQRILERDEIPEGLGGRVRTYATWEYRDLFGQDDELLGPHADDPTWRKQRETVRAGRQPTRTRPRRRDWSQRRHNWRGDE